MRIFTQINETHRDQLSKANQSTPFAIDIVFEAGVSKTIEHLTIHPMSVDNINFIMDSFQLSDFDAKVKVKEMDQFLKDNGYRGKRVLAHTLHKFKNGDLYVESDKYAVAIVL